MTIYVCTYFKSIKWLLPDDLCVLGSFESLEKERAERASERARFIGENCGRLSLAAADVSWKKRQDGWGSLDRCGMLQKESHWIPFWNAMESHKFRVNLARSLPAHDERHSSMSVALPLGAHTHMHMYTTDWLHVKRTHTNALIFIEQKHNQSIGFMCSNSR